MNQAQIDLLNLRHLPARLRIEEAASFLGFAAHEIPVLMAAGLLKPLGRPAASGSKFFATVELQRLRENPQWLARASDMIVHHWRRKNAGRPTRRGSNLVAGQEREPALAAACCS